MKDTRLCVRALYKENGDYLIIKENTPGGIYWKLPGGGVEEGETLEQALEREVGEELSTESTTINPVPVGSYTFPTSDDRTAINIVYEVELVDTYPFEEGEDKILDHKLSPVDEAAELTAKWEKTFWEELL